MKAWFILHLLAKEYSLSPNLGFIFNMSVGYDLDGIRSPKINAFIDNLSDASRTAIWKECKDYILNNLKLFKHIDQEFVEKISPRICSSITSIDPARVPLGGDRKNRAVSAGGKKTAHLRQTQSDLAGLRVCPQDPGQDGLRLSGFRRASFPARPPVRRSRFDADQTQWFCRGT